MSDIHLDPFDDPALVPQLVKAPVDQWKSILETSTRKSFPSYGADPNYALVKSALQKAGSLGVTYDYALVTGDYVSHNFKDDFHKYAGGDDRALKDFSTKTILFVTELVQQSLPGVPVYFAVGNHDSECDNYRMSSQDDLWKVLAKAWSTVAADPRAAGDFTQGGYYETAHPTLANREIIVLNSVFWGKKYEKGCGANSGNPGDEEMAWLQKILDQARADKKTVTFEMHIPPGIDSEKAKQHLDEGKNPKTFWKPKYEDEFLKLVWDYRELIRGNFAGHTHMDDFRVALSRQGHPFLLTHITPGICQIDGNNPGFQVALYDKAGGRLEDLATFYVPDLRSADPGQNPWRLEYTFQQAYGYPAYTMENLVDLAARIGSDPTVRQKYIDFYGMKTPVDPPIDGNNWKSFNCAQTHMDPESYQACYR